MLRATTGEGMNQQAAYCVQNDVNFNEALTWINTSIDMNKNSENVFTKSQLLFKTGESKASDEMLTEALNLADVGQRNSLGWQLWKYLDQAERAVQVYLRNIEEADDWIAHYLLAQLYYSIDNKNDAIKYARLSVKKAPNEGRKTVAENLLASYEK